jgi:murein L,D-transpeptidase YcbB/YkuD
MSYTDTSFLAKLKPYVLADMRSSGILASLTAAQAFIESNKGNSGLTVKCNNLFGIKGKYKGQSGSFMTTEYYNGVKQRVMADFRKYPSWQESIADHSSLFNRLSRYSNLRGLKDYKLACKYVKDDGYATSPTYTQTLINTIEKYKLYEWDNEVINGNVSAAEVQPTWPTLSKGSTGQHVTILQQRLTSAGYGVGKIDGIFGAKTLEAVKALQVDKGLSVDGIVGPKTWEKLIR